MDKTYAGGYYPTKYYELMNRTGDQRYGYYFEFNYDLQKWFGFGFSLQDASSGNLTTMGRKADGQPMDVPGQGYFQMHIDVPLPWYLSFHATYHKIQYSSITELFDMNPSNTILLATFKFRPVNFIGIYATLQEAWELNSWTGLYELVPMFQVGLDLSYNFW
jgi:hypothetical protein